MIRASEWAGELSGLISQYTYQPELTTRLDNLGAAPFDQPLINEIVLWKINRFAQLDQASLSDLNSLTAIQNGAHRKSENVLRMLLRRHGVDLAMASTFLRFRNPTAFQIIDRHAYRAVYGVKYPLASKSSLDKKIDIYFQFLDDVNSLAKRKDLDFRTIDRLLYVYDKVYNGKL